MRAVIVGAGGHARSVLEAIRSGAAGVEPVACTDPDRARWGSELDGVPVIGDDEELAVLLDDGVTAAVIGLGATGDNQPRERLHAQLRERGFELPSIVHASCVVASSASIGDASQVLAGAIVGAGVRIGENVIINNGAIVEHDCEVNDHAHLATGSVVGGGVSVGRGAHVGIGACVMHGLTIGAAAVVGAGAVVIRDVPAGQVVVGCPAAPLPARQ